jgi:hypothetical protein
MAHGHPEPKCPIRVGDPCNLCFPGASGPQDCGLVYLVQSDDELREELAARRRDGAANRSST